MRYTPFRMERWQSTHEHRVRVNLSESGVHPITLGELLGDGPEAVQRLLEMKLDYPHVNGVPELRDHIALTCLSTY